MKVDSLKPHLIRDPRRDLKEKTPVNVKSLQCCYILTILKSRPTQIVGYRYMQTNQPDNTRNTDSTHNYTRPTPSDIISFEMYSSTIIKVCAANII
jgi:hypothetical protein